MSRNTIRSHVAALLLAAVAAAPSVGAAPAAPAASGQDEGPLPASAFSRHPGGLYVVTRSNGAVGCREATAEELVAFERRIYERSDDLLVNERSEKQSGLRIILQPTNQLNSFPQAKEAFLRAAAEWESRIQNPITIIIDVDFGRTFFGQSYPEDVIGSTFTQSLIGSNLYSNIRSRLVSGASSPAESSLYASLPTSQVPTDIGPTATVVAPSANLRALGVINAVANPDAEGNFGDPPAIGFNSEIPWDFNPDDGISSSLLDFDSVALHEIGHALGFASESGERERDSDNPLAVSVLDLFRFRPGITSGAFGSSQRVLSSGGRHVFFANTGQFELSTGRADGTGGDGQQPSHWKEGNVFNGSFIGLMDPVIFNGERNPLTAADITAFDTIGYRLTPANVINFDELSASLRGDVLTLSGSATSTAGTIREVEVSLLDTGGAVLTTYPRMAISVAQSGSFSIDVEGLALEPAAVAARVTLIAEGGARSDATEVDFSGAETGAPTVTKFKRKNANLTLTGAGFSREVQLEINGVTIPLPASAKIKAGGAKLKLKTGTIGLESGPNRIRVVLDGRYSNIVVVSI